MAKKNVLLATLSPSGLELWKKTDLPESLLRAVSERLGKGSYLSVDYESGEVSVYIGDETRAD